jgi:hypothetical protein
MTPQTAHAGYTADELFALPLQTELPHYVIDAHAETVAICDDIEQAKYFAAAPVSLETLERENNEMRQLILALAASEPCTNHGLLLRKRANAMIARAALSDSTLTLDMNRIVLKCEPERHYLFGATDKEFVALIHDSKAAACYRQAIEETRPQLSADANQLLDHIEQRAAGLLAEKLR